MQWVSGSLTSTCMAQLSVARAITRLVRTGHYLPNSNPRVHMGQTATDWQLLWTAGEGFVNWSTRDEKTKASFSHKRLRSHMWYECSLNNAPPPACRSHRFQTGNKARESEIAKDMGKKTFDSRTKEIVDGEGETFLSRFAGLFQAGLQGNTLG
jgi:hypothetical protein